MEWDIGANGGLALALTWLYFMCWSSYGIEAVASFAPEYHSTEVDTPLALRSSALFSVVVYVLLPLGVGGTLGTETIAKDTTFIAFYTQAFDKLVGSALGNVMIFCLVAGLILSMNTATMDGSRALYGIARDGMTIKQFGTLNKWHVPGTAMTLDMVINILLIVFFHGVIEILAVSNIGYVFATCCALFGYVLLRKDRPNWPRPIKYGSPWVVLAFLLGVVNTVFLIAGGFIYSGGFLGIEGYGYGWDKTRTGLIVLAIAFLLYLYRHIVQDKTGIRFRDEVPQMPEEEAAQATAAPAT